MSVDLSGKVAIITGSGRGLGLAYAVDMVKHGARVVINDVDESVANAAVSKLQSAGGEAVAVVAPVGSAETARLLVDTAVNTYGRLDIMVTNAGILRDSVLWKTSDEDFDAVIGVHLRGTFMCVREAAAYMRKQGEGGNIICIGSPTGQMGNFGQTAYAAAKAGVVGMVRTWALELRKAEIAVNALIPVAATALTTSVPAFAELGEMIDRGEVLPPFARKAMGFGSPDDVSPMVTFLASERARNITGQAIGIGGDRVALWSHPAEIVIAVSDGWTAGSIADQWTSTFASSQQPVGQPDLIGLLPQNTNA